MALKDLKFKESDFISKKIADLSNTPSSDGMTAEMLKAYFDNMPKVMIAMGGFNDLIDALIEIGIEKAVISDNIVYIRLNSDKVIETSSDGVNWEATGSSGHVIVKEDGSQMAQRSRLKFNGVDIIDDGINTVINGLKGDKGDTGEKGEKGDTGATGATGSQGPTGKVIVPSVNAAGVISWQIQDEAIAPSPISIRGPQGIQGVQGAQGVQGERGPQGIQGPAGPQGIQGNQGPAGTIGPTGPAGPTGATGAKGDKGEKGDSGVYYGSSEPGETYDVWIDPDGSGTEIPTTEEVQAMIDESTSDFLTDIDITAEQTSTGATITIGSKSVTLENGTDGRNGTDGKDGVDGKDGTDGYTPIKGKDYFDGEDGYTPVKGIDYYTDEEKAEMVQAVIAALPTAEGGAY